MRFKDYFTKQGVNLPWNDLNKLKEACERLLSEPNPGDDEIAITVSSLPFKVAVVKDNYKGKTYYGIRQFFYQNG
jgi:hypothetical protein